MNGALNGDTVIIELLDKNAIKKEGKILRILKRDVKNLVGEFYFQDNKGYVKIDDDKLNIIVELPYEDCTEAVNGHKVVVEITDYGKNGRKPEGKVVEIIYINQIFFCFYRI